MRCLWCMCMLEKSLLTLSQPITRVQKENFIRLKNDSPLGAWQCATAEHMSDLLYSLWRCSSFGGLQVCVVRHSRSRGVLERKKRSGGPSVWVGSSQLLDHPS